MTDLLFNNKVEKQHFKTDQYTVLYQFICLDRLENVFQLFSHTNVISLRSLSLIFNKSQHYYTDSRFNQAEKQSSSQQT